MWPRSHVMGHARWLKVVPFSSWVGFPISVQWIGLRLTVFEIGLRNRQRTDGPTSAIDSYLTLKEGHQYSSLLNAYSLIISADLKQLNCIACLWLCFWRRPTAVNYTGGGGIRAASDEDVTAKLLTNLRFIARTWQPNVLVSRCSSKRSEVLLIAPLAHPKYSTLLKYWFHHRQLALSATYKKERNLPKTDNKTPNSVM